MTRIMLIGSDYFPYEGSGDKNFWLELVSLFEEEFEEIIILSLNNWSKKIVFQSSKTIIYNVPPIRLMGKNETGRKCHKGFHKNYIEKTLTIFRIIREIKKIKKKHKVDVVHFMDNYGPAMFLIKRILKDINITASIPSYEKKLPIYDTMLKLSVLNFDTVVPYSETLKRKLNSIGISKNKLVTIHWGVNTSKIKRINRENEETKKISNMDDKRKIILWSGYLQQSNYNDFLSSLKTARKVTKRLNNCKFLFAFKPEHFEPEYASFSQENVEILTKIEIHKMLNITDVLLSPISAKDSIIAPPLLWLEAMAYGIPLITIKTGGVEECVIDGINGYIGNEDNLDETLIRMLTEENKLKQMSENARKYVEEKYNIKYTAERYISVWNERHEED